MAYRGRTRPREFRGLVRVGREITRTRRTNATRKNGGR